MQCLVRLPDTKLSSCRKDVAMPVVNACSQKCWQQQQATKSRFAEEPFTFNKFQMAAKSKQMQKQKKQKKHNI